MGSAFRTVPGRRRLPFGGGGIRVVLAVLRQNQNAEPRHDLFERLHYLLKRAENILDGKRKQWKHLSFCIYSINQILTQKKTKHKRQNDEIVFGIQKLTTYS